MSVIRQFYGQAPALLTDLYQLTMAYAHWYNGTGQREAVFHLFFRNAPFGNRFAIACGLDSVLEFVEDFRFTNEDIRYLATLKDNAGQPLFANGFLEYLRDFRFTGQIDAIPEGTAVFPHQPLLRVTAPIVEAQILETTLLTLMNFPTLVATKAARVVDAAAGDPVLDFGLRKAQGADGGLSASRAAYIGGCSGTANVLAGKLFGIPVSGTHAHGWVMAFEKELEAFEFYAKALPNQCIFLVDTYDTIAGVKNAIKIGKKLRANGHHMAGIRLDSGDLESLSHAARSLLDEAGFGDVSIAASSSLDEDAVGHLKQVGAPISLWGIGTKLTTAQPDAALDGVYKLGAIKKDNGVWSYRMKLSDTPGKSSRPGVLQVRRYHDETQNPHADLLYDQAAENRIRWQARDGGKWRHFEDDENFHDLLIPVFRQGKRIYESPSLETIREHAIAQFAYFKRQTNYSVLVDRYLEESTRNLKQWLTHGHDLHPSHPSTESTHESGAIGR